jgi:CxxH/CxxC protein (TIGR04129 family)
MYEVLYRKIKLYKSIFYKGEEKMIYSCEEHVDIALDSIVVKYETYPVLDKVPVDKLSTICEFCKKQAVYVVANK